MNSYVHTVASLLAVGFNECLPTALYRKQVASHHLSFESVNRGINDRFRRLLRNLLLWLGRHARCMLLNEFTKITLAIQVVLESVVQCISAIGYIY